MGAQKLSAKLKGIWLILTANHVLLMTVKNGNMDGVGFGGGDLSEIMTIAIQVKRTYNSMINMIENSAEEAGELHSLLEMRKTIEELDDGGK